MKAAQSSAKDGTSAPDDQAPSNSGPFHALMQSLADVHEKPSKPSKKDEDSKAHDSPNASPAPTTTERKPPIVWNLAQALTHAQDVVQPQGTKSLGNDPNGDEEPTVFGKDESQGVVDSQSHPLSMIAGDKEANLNSQLQSQTSTPALMPAQPEIATDGESEGNTEAPLAPPEVQPQESETSQLQTVEPATLAKPPAQPVSVSTTAKPTRASHRKAETTGSDSEHHIEIIRTATASNAPQPIAAAAAIPVAAHTAPNRPDSVEGIARSTVANPDAPITSASDATGPDTTAAHRAPLLDAVANAIPFSPVSDASNAPIAFEARLRPVTPAQTSPQTADVNVEPRPLQPEPSPAEPRAAHTSVTPNMGAADPSPEKQNEDTHEPPDRENKPIAATKERAAVSSAQPEIPSSNAASFPAAVTAPVSTARSAAPAPSHTPEPQAAPAAAPTPGPAPAAAHDIKIALNDNGQRVELRVTERGGDIHVAVRTPDAPLATSLRNDLPALSNKLEESGFHSEMWHPSALPSGENKTVETTGGNASSDSRGQSGGRQQGEESQQNPKNPQQQFNRKSDRKEFTWLYQSIR